MTWNIYGLPVRGYFRRVKAIRAMFEEMAPDIAFVQEDWPGILKPRGYHRFKQGGGLATLVKKQVLKAVRTTAHKAYASPALQRLTPRGVVDYVGEKLGGKRLAHVEIDTEEGPYHLVNTHLACLDSNAPTSQLGLRTDPTIDEQKATLATYLLELRGTGIPILAGGDFNGVKLLPSVNNGTRHFEELTAEVTLPEPFWRYDGQVDHVFGSPRIQPTAEPRCITTQIAPDFYPSDHPAFVVECETK